MVDVVGVKGQKNLDGQRPVIRRAMHCIWSSAGRGPMPITCRLT